MITTTCCIGLGTVPELVVTEVNVPVFEKLEVSTPLELEIVSVDRLCVVDSEMEEVWVIIEEVISCVLVEACRISYPESTAMVIIAAKIAPHPIFLLRVDPLEVSAMPEKQSVERICFSRGVNTFGYFIFTNPPIVSVRFLPE
jgi:hypothetical protein